MDLGFPVAFVSLLDGRLGFVEKRQSLQGGARLEAGLGDQAQPVRPGQLGAGGELSGQPAAHLGNPFREIAILGERPAFEYGSHCVDEHEAMRFRERERLVDQRASRRDIAPVLAHDGGQDESKGDAVGVLDLRPKDRQVLLAVAQRLVHVAEQP